MTAPKRGRGRPRKPPKSGPLPLPRGVPDLYRGDMDGMIATAWRTARIPEALAEACERPAKGVSRYWDARHAGATHDEAVARVRAFYDAEEAGKERRPRGRPPRKEERRLQVAVRVLDDGMEERWRGWARRAGMTLGDLVAAAVEEYGTRRRG